MQRNLDKSHVSQLPIFFSGGFFVYLKGECHEKSFHTETVWV